MSNSSILAGVSTSLSAFERARQLQDAAAAVGFDWPEMSDIRKKIHEELDELEQGLDNLDTANIFEELGDVLFALTNLARRLQMDPAAALEATNQKFIRRFQHMEQGAAREGSNLASEPLTMQIIRYRQAWSEDQTTE
jgi:nucleoside triphosphate diphosphatase